MFEKRGGHQCSALLTVGKLTVGEGDRVEREDVTSILIHNTGQDYLYTNNLTY